MGEAARAADGAGDPQPCCPYFHEAVELVGRRWSGAIISVLIDQEPLRFGELAKAVPQISDRMLTERVAELQRRGIVRRDNGAYALTPMGRDLEPAVEALQRWGRRWLSG
ncbi:MAG TPA: helix-turn-helix domain-containing protein [Solirubrobacteraceae bacterium]|nr:helix-turn-helix domain-containing protein [Solirubrobacteraceae bacterium]